MPSLKNSHSPDSYRGEEGRGEANKKSLLVKNKMAFKYRSKNSGYNLPEIASLTLSLGTICSLKE